MKTNLMEASSTSIEVIITKAHIRRLKHYFERRGAQCVSDGTDLDLLGWKLIEIKSSSFSSHAQVTDLGAERLHLHRRAIISARSEHHDLGGRFASYLRQQGRITWENIEFRNRVIVPDIDYERWQCVRPDVYSILPSLNLKGANPCVHEIKVSRSDFLNDISKPEKREAYAAMAEAVYYVAPEGIINPIDIPQGFGLIVEKSIGQFSLIKRPRKRKIELQPWHYLNMIVKPGAYPESYLD